RDDLADDLDILARALEGAGVRLPVPSFDHLRTGRAETEDEAAAGEMVEGDRGHRRGGGGAGGDLGGGGAELEPLGPGAPPGERRQAVRAVGFGGPDGVEAEALGLGDALLD